MTRRLGTGFARGAVGVLVSVACVYLVIRGVDLGKTLDLLGGAKPAWLLLAVAAVGGDLAFRAVRWQILIRPICRVPLRRLSAYMLVGYLANNVLPARLGELVRSHYLGDREGISRSATLGTVVVERVVDTVVLVGIGAAAILVLNVRGVVVSAILVGVAVAGLLCVALAVALAAHRLPGAGRAAAFLARWPRVVGVAARLRDGLRVAALPRTVAAAAVLSVAAWSCTVVAVLAVGQSLGIQLTVGEGALLAAGTNLATAIPSGPGYLGTFEYAGQSIALAFGLGAPEGLALALLIHVLTLAVSSIGGIAALFRLGWTGKAGAAGKAGPAASDNSAESKVRGRRDADAAEG
jgi:glycosyltransferase 2 family protein